MNKFQVGEEVLVIKSDVHKKIVNQRAIILSVYLLTNSTLFSPYRYKIKVPGIMENHDTCERYLERLEPALTPEEWFARKGTIQWKNISLR